MSDKYLHQHEHQEPQQIRDKRPEKDWIRTLCTVFHPARKPKKEQPVSFPMSLTGVAFREQLDTILDITLRIALLMNAKPSNRVAK